jgi:Lrp/AsnC family leucine-responsive transcriptional regulator
VFDAIDLTILRLLQSDARLANAEIARQVGMAPSAVYERIRKLEEGGVLTGYAAYIDPGRVGLGLLAFIFIRTVGGCADASVGRRLSEMPEVLEVHDVAGDDCYIVKVRAADTGALSRLLKERIGTVPNIQSTRTTVVLSTVKETSELPLPPPSAPPASRRG